MVKIAGGALLASIAIDRTAPSTISTQICAAIRKMIFSGALGAGQRLPSSRPLAQELGVSRTTVINVFDHLAEEGLIRSEEHTSELQSLLRISSAVFCLTKKTNPAHISYLHHPS